MVRDVSGPIAVTLIDPTKPIDSVEAVGARAGTGVAGEAVPAPNAATTTGFATSVPERLEPALPAAETSVESPPEAAASSV
jgi:hypothetical protein